MRTLRIAFLTIVSGFILSTGCGFAFAGSIALDQLRSVAGNADGTYDGAANRRALGDVNDHRTAAAVSSSTVASAPSDGTTPAAATPPVPPAPTLVERMGKDLNDNKMDYAIAGATGALTGYFLMGSVMTGALFGFGILLIFLLLLRNVK